MNTIELIEDAALFGGNVPNERISEVRDFLSKLKSEALNMHVVSQQRELLAISCLNNIVNPIKYLKDLAEVDEGKLDGGFAIHLTKQGMFYQELAKKALKEIDNCG